MHAVYARFVQEMPDHPAFVEGGRVWSYREFSDAVDAAAGDLTRLGVRPGDRVMVASENSVMLGALLFAASKLDAWGIATNPRLSARELDLIAEHSGARRVLLNVALSQEAAAHAERTGADRLGRSFHGSASARSTNRRSPSPSIADGQNRSRASCTRRGPRARRRV